ncbi:MAG: M20/M25/M40 family metallo-hydrolase [Patescibacteria group bacterium]
MDLFETKKALRDHLTSLTKELVRFPSHVNEPLKIFELIEFIKSYFEKEKVVANMHVFGGLPSLVITTEETKSPRILLSGHIDVVPSSTRYITEEEDGWLFGSGAMDMKGGVAVMMALMKHWSRQEKPPSLGIMITSDEEIGSDNGTTPLLEQEGYRADFVLINEGRYAYDIVTREKGILLVNLVTTGEFIHSAYPWRAKNSIEELMKALLEIKKIFPPPSDAWVPTCSVTIIRGGEETNTIPGRAEAVLNIRLTGGKRWCEEAVLKKIKKCLPKNIEIAEANYGEVFLSDERNPYIRSLRKVARKVLKNPVSFGENHGASDARIFMKHGITTAVLGPVGKNHHTPLEAVDIESLVTHFEVLKKFIAEESRSLQKSQVEILKT